jgi:hypothetical protein
MKKKLEAAMHSVKELSEVCDTEEIRAFLDYLNLLYDGEMNKIFKELYGIDPEKFTK